MMFIIVIFTVFTTCWIICRTIKVAEKQTETFVVYYSPMVERPHTTVLSIV
jgi:hypothetical protein